MALFAPSTVPWATAVQQIADSVGASGDTEMLARAHTSLRSAFQYFNNKVRWNFLRSEGNPTPVVAPYSLAITASAGVASASALTGHGVQIDDILIGSGLIAGNRVSATGASGFGFNVAISAFSAGATPVTITVVRDSYDLPTGWKATYSLRLLGSKRVLRYVGRRLYDRSETDEYTSGTPDAYDLYNSGGRGRIRLLPPPSSADVMVHRYLRSMTMASASGVSAALDIPEDYEQYPVAWAKWHFMTDKNQERAEQGQTWLTLANEGIQTMINNEQNLPDENLAFLPANVISGYPSDNSTRAIDWGY